MKYNTTRFGEIEFPEEVIMTFPEGMLGFETSRRYILLEHDTEGSPFKWLQSIDDPNLAFIVIDPMVVDSNYRFEIDVDTQRMIGTDQPTECAVMSIVNVNRNSKVQVSVNLKAPLVVNVENRIGRQIILGTNVYAISTPLIEQEKHDAETALEQRAAS